MTVASRERAQGLSELAVALLLLGLGLAVVADANGLQEGLGRNTAIGPKVIPFTVGAGLALIGLLLAVDVLRGGRGEQEAGEDVDLTHGSDWRTVAILAASFVANIVLIERVGWPISGAVLFFGSAYALGSRRTVRDVAIALTLSIGTWYLFVVGLGIDLPVGVLEGIL